MELHRILNPVTSYDKKPATTKVKSSTVTKSSVSGIFNSTSVTKAYTAATSAYTQSLTRGASTAHMIWRSAYTLPISYSAYGRRNSASHRTVLLSGRLVLPMITEPYRHYDSTSDPPFLPRFKGHPGHTLKRKASKRPLSEEGTSKKRSKWTLEEDNIMITRRGQGIK
jgi:hypothetical protein